jgi:hypothetical protein
MVTERRERVQPGLYSVSTEVKMRGIPYPLSMHRNDVVLNPFKASWLL